MFLPFKYGLLETHNCILRKTKPSGFGCFIVLIGETMCLYISFASKLERVHITLYNLFYFLLNLPNPIFFFRQNLREQILLFNFLLLSERTCSTGLLNQRDITYSPASHTVMFSNMNMNVSQCHGKRSKNCVCNYLVCLPVVYCQCHNQLCCPQKW